MTAFTDEIQHIHGAIQRAEAEGFLGFAHQLQMYLADVIERDRNRRMEQFGRCSACGEMRAASDPCCPTGSIVTDGDGPEAT